MHAFSPFHCQMVYIWCVVFKSCIRKVGLCGRSLHCYAAVACALTWNDSSESPRCLLMNRPRCACSCKAGYKGSVGLVGPSATGSDSGHGCLNGFTPELLSKHIRPSDWSARLSNHSSAQPFRTTAAGSASARSFIGSPARLFYMNQRANDAFLPRSPPLGFVATYKNVTKHEPLPNLPKRSRLFMTFKGVFTFFVHVYR